MKVAITSFFLALYTSVSCQEVLTSSGDYFSSSEGSLSWTLGEPISETYNQNHILTQGFQQDYENILSVTQLTAHIYPLVYPNPFTNKVFIDLPEFFNSNEDLKVDLKDNTGRSVYKTQISNVITLDNLSDGIYYLELTIGINTKYTYKLVKTAN
jgi:hypothetical protein